MDFLGYVWFLQKVGAEYKTHVIYMTAIVGFK